MEQARGIVSQIIGPVVDVHFTFDDKSSAALPGIHEALTVLSPGGRKLTV